MPRRGRAPQTPPETIYAPLAPMIRDARQRGLSDEDIYDRIEGAKRQARALGYSGGEISQALLSESVEPEARAKGFLRGVAKGLSLGFYVPESLEQAPNELRQGIPLGPAGELDPEGVGEVVSGLGTAAGGVGALRAGRAAGRLAGRGFGKLRKRLNEDPVFEARFVQAVAALATAAALGGAFAIGGPPTDPSILDRGRR